MAAVSNLAIVRASHHAAISIQILTPSNHQPSCLPYTAVVMEDIPGYHYIAHVCFFFTLYCFMLTNDLIQTPSIAQWCAAIISYNISNSVTAGLDLFTRLVKLLSDPLPGYKVSIFNVSHFSFHLK